MAKRFDKQTNILPFSSREGGWEFSLLSNKAYWVQHVTEGKYFYTE